MFERLAKIPNLLSKNLVNGESDQEFMWVVGEGDNWQSRVAAAKKVRRYLSEYQEDTGQLLEPPPYMTAGHELRHSALIPEGIRVKFTVTENDRRIPIKASIQFNDANIELSLIYRLGLANVLRRANETTPHRIVLDGKDLIDARKDAGGIPQAELDEINLEIFGPNYKQYVRTFKLRGKK